MRPRRNLGILGRRALRRLRTVYARLDDHTIPPSAAQERDLALCLIDAQNIWAGFVRHFFISCLFGATTATGARVRNGIGAFASEGAAVDYAKTVVKGLTEDGPLSEPQWHQSSVLTKLAAAASLSNAQQIGVAYSVVGRALEDLPKARNFYAHRSRHSAKVLIGLRTSYEIPSAVRPALIPAQRHPKVPHTIAREWVAELIRRIALMPQ